MAGSWSLRCWMNGETTYGVLCINQKQWTKCPTVIWIHFKNLVPEEKGGNISKQKGVHRTLRKNNLLGRERELRKWRWKERSEVSYRWVMKISHELSMINLTFFYLGHKSGVWGIIWQWYVGWVGEEKIKGIKNKRVKIIQVLEHEVII